MESKDKERLQEFYEDKKLKIGQYQLTDGIYNYILTVR